MPFLKNISELTSNFLNKFNQKKTIIRQNNINKLSSINKTDFNKLVDIELGKSSKKLKEFNKLKIGYTSDILNEGTKNYYWRKYDINRNFAEKLWKRFTGQVGQEKSRLSDGQEQTFKQGMKYLTAADSQEKRVRTQLGRIGERQAIVGGGIVGAYGTVALRNEIQNPDELINRLEQPITYGNGYTQQYPSSYRDRLINILNNTTL